MKARHAANRAKKEKIDTNVHQVELPDLPSHIPHVAKEVIEENLDLRDTVETLTRQVQELLKAQQDRDSKSPRETSRETPGMNQDGSLIGSYERYTLDPHYYPDPRERLADEPRLKRFAFSDNYELTFSVSTVQYTTIDNRRIKEPRFMLELVRIILDEDTGEPTNQRYVVCRSIMHEDPEAAIEIAGRNGVTVDTSNQKQFLDEMRYLRMRDWLLEAFYPPKSDDKKNKRETVIGNKLVEIYEVSHEVGAPSPSIPFESLKKY
jgi:hypothetical protein